MRSSQDRRFGPGTSVLGGAASGLSYEGCLRDAMAEEERASRREAARRRPVPAPQQQQAQRPADAERQAARQVMA
jgi:hypothetical protein